MPLNSDSLLFSFCIPVRDDPDNLRACLEGLRSQDLTDCEVLVCDDGSEPAVDYQDLRRTGVKVALFRQKGSGPSVARNHLARLARGQFLFFIDADTVPRADMLDCARRIVASNPGIAAFFGSYDDEPEHRTLISTYRNLLHHFTHHRSGGQRVETFWCGCGVINRQLFLDAGGLSPFYARPSIEDIELGARVSAEGTAVRVFPDLQVKHRKLWTLKSWLHTDLFCRGIPWIRLMKSTNNWKSQLNFSWSQRLATLSAMAFVCSLPVLIVFPQLALATTFALLAFVALNWSFFNFIRRKRGMVAAAATIPLHLTYAMVCVTSLVAGYLYPVVKMPPNHKLEPMERETESMSGVSQLHVGG